MLIHKSSSLHAVRAHFSVKRWAKTKPYVRNIYSMYKSLGQFFRFRIGDLFGAYFGYMRDFAKYRELERRSEHNRRFQLLPCLLDKTEMTPLEPVYFFQDTWAARKIYELKPSRHVDVGSSAKTIGILSQFTPITMIDIRPLPVELPGLTFQKGSILALPFASGSVESISSLCVVEHIGLGRYGDELDADGSEKAAKELQRVIKPGGIILCSIPVDAQNKIYFNAHRAMTRDCIISLFKDCDLLEEKYQYGYELCDSYDAQKGFGTGLYMFRKR